MWTWIVLTLFALFTLAFFVKARKKHDGFNHLVEIVSDAASAGERAYVAQIEQDGKMPSFRGVALARLATALFPIAAYAMAEADGNLKAEYKKSVPLSGKDVWKIASGAALQKFGGVNGHAEELAVKEDTHFATNAFVDLINAIFSSGTLQFDDPIATLSPIWSRAIVLSGGDESSGRAIQYVASGVPHMIDTYNELSRKSWGY